MARSHASKYVSAFDCDVIRDAFKRWVIEENIAEDQWRDRALRLIHGMTGIEHVDPDMLDWIMRK